MGRPCSCCGKEADLSILLVRGVPGDEDSRYPRWYLPNHLVRAEPDLQEEVWFCASCIRIIEDNLRATILYLQSEHGRIQIE